YASMRPQARVAGLGQGSRRPADLELVDCRKERTMFRSMHTLGVMALAGATLLAGNVSTAPAQDASDMSYLMNQVSRGLREEARRRRLDNDRRQFDLDYYMRQQTPTAEEQRE